MKVIKPGKPWSKQVTCTGDGNSHPGCGALLEIEKEDLFRTSRHLYDGSSERYITITCPQCGADTDLKNIPFSVSDLPAKTAWEANRK